MRNTLNRREWTCGAVALAGGLWPGAALRAQPAWPSRPVQLVVPFAAGGSADMLARLLAEHLAGALQQAVVVENRPGATGVLGSNSVARAQPDGHTLLLGFDGTLAIAPLLQANPGFDPVKSFAPIAKLADVDLVVAAHPSVAARDMRELVALSQARPQSLSYGSPGIGSTAHLAGELLRQRAALDWVHVPYGGSGSGRFVLDLIGGSLPTAIISVAVAGPFIRDRKIVGIGLPAAQRSALLPETPTFREAGLTDMDVASWFGLLAPAGTPAPVLARLHQASQDFLRLPAARERLAEAGMSVTPGTADAFGARIRSDLEKWTGVARQAGL